MQQAILARYVCAISVEYVRNAALSVRVCVFVCQHIAFPLPSSPPITLKGGEVIKKTKRQQQRNKRENNFCN